MEKVLYSTALLLLNQTLTSNSPDINLDLTGKFLQYSNFNEIVFGKPPISRSKIHYKFCTEQKIKSTLIQEHLNETLISKRRKLYRH